MYRGRHARLYEVPPDMVRHRDPAAGSRRAGMAGDHRRFARVASCSSVPRWARCPDRPANSAAGDEDLRPGLSVQCVSKTQFRTIGAREVSVRIALTALVAAVLAVLAGLGVYSAAQPAAKQVQTPTVNYGSRP